MYKVLFSTKAKEDLDASLMYISKKLKNPIAAHDLITKIENKLRYLKNYPKSHPLVRDKYLKNRGIRYMLINNYILFYQIAESKQEIHIVRFLYSRRNWKDLLHEAEG
ncbi:type II toxin-antitoxin system RelE/ParE family toxin [Spirochaeta africana]|uniref:Addiction module toxin, RelE/StbE family n=1 Tax=Spirochaeta africana (strain ATCC 700263 / DSM 8902 / Z-7692) TaxID=889378 RepID=H9UGW9_SPIAZ|nr:addiction module toxin, RelE/StbE family [Spirochaeta africana DSM 8902]